MRPNTRIPDSVLDDVRESARTPAVGRLRSAAVALLVVVILLGLAGFLGVRSGTAHASGGGYDLTLEYPRIARAGLDVPWNLTVRKDGGFIEPVVIALDSAYFEMFETQGWSPQPSAETRSADRIYLTVDPPPGDTLVLGFDAYIQPSSQRGASGSVAVSEGGADVVALDFTTWLVP